ncbi:transcriptional regulator [Actinophytocola xinjiangensis]|uniref:Transcriptional regulator n=1 Tax=Actinophytocola xinjiangensis TaxID=485602 RepID=A0A7Z1AXH3_9PSEU|nr:helix-turn-helix transcriptional regulator [Actinophytocola xinjiangensis]OLF07717.1 transcriptional regulator [Actinophytocola xinjiangensis]
MDDSVGKRIAKRRGKLFTQQGLADRAQVSVDVIRKLEQGQRHTASVDVFQRIARALDVPLSRLLDKQDAVPSEDPDAGVVAIRHALTPVDDLLDDDVIDTAPLTVEDAERTVTYMWGCYWSGRYELLSRLLPEALIGLRATASAVPVADRPRAARALARGYQAAGDTLVHLDQPDAAWLAIREAMRAARESNDELLDAALRVSVAWQLLVQGRYDESERVALAAARGVEPAGDVNDAQLATYGVLTSTAATAAARSRRASTANDLLGVAGEVANRLGYERSECQTTFGPAKVAMMSVDCAVVQDDYGDALANARNLPRDAALPLASRARHLADVAMAHLRLGHGDRALTTILSMEQLAPDWIEYQALPRQMVSELVEQERRVSAPLRELAIRLGAYPD